MYVPVAGLTPISGFYGEPLAKGGNPIMPDDLLAGPATRDIRICARFGCWPALGWGLPPPQTTRLFFAGSLSPDLRPTAAPKLLCARGWEGRITMFCSWLSRLERQLQQLCDNRPKTGRLNGQY
jgi:hypothetical protein